MKTETKLFITLLSVQAALVTAEIILTEIGVSTGKAFEANAFSLWLLDRVNFQLMYILYLAFHMAVSVAMICCFILLKRTLRDLQFVSGRIAFFARAVPVGFLVSVFSMLHLSVLWYVLNNFSVVMEAMK